MCNFYGPCRKDWENDPSIIRGLRAIYYQNFSGAEEILLDCVAHQRDDRESIQCVVNFLMQRWRNPLTEPEAYTVAREYVEASKNHAAHWATWISPTLITHSPKMLTPRPPPIPNVWRQDHIKGTSDPQSWSRLLSLPAELRIQILENAVTPSTTTTPFSDKSTGRGIIVGTRASLHPPIARTCRELRHETLPIFYSTNTFIFAIDTFSALHKSRLWLSNLTDKFCGHLQNILFLGFDRLPIMHFLGNPPLPHGIAMTLRRHYSLGTVRLAINLRTLTMNLETEVPSGGEWLIKWEGILKELRECTEGMEVGEWYLRTMVTEFGRGVEDLQRRGKRVEWYA